ncbi:Metallo-hydrolase/oxidoreductase [Piromyces finnis]|uniref:Metallo-hydrolase/oxidoreductase n=1 Tax=Piromyces finnis TaxID=1754191 RepID=A0A1Y1V2N7_9FUNG|nr:Metallo-hydrolase/oxidoreductase [Piromyces finnis]|eukprot:ORX45755.1 Metallo-hydrolase/oxidoreductase [Piromyces finnis]
MANTIDITFLGTSSAQPSTTRNHSSLGVRVNGTVWLFDAGEGTQRQLMYSTLKLGKVNKVFITHLHGDHIYGLPGLVCTLTAALNPQNHMDRNWDEEDTTKDPENTPCLEIYGPVGLRNYLRSALTFSYSRLPIYYRVHELVLPEQESKEIEEGNTSPDKQNFLDMRERFSQQLKSDVLHPDELLGEDIQPDDDGLFRDLLQIEKKYETSSDNKNSKKFKGDPVKDKICVHASYIKHSVPALGYVLEEYGLEGNIRMELVKPALLRNKDSLVAQGITQPLSLIRELKRGKILNLPDGTTLDPKDVITPTEKRKIVILGDTNNPSKIAPLAQNSTILIHEATNMYEGSEKTQSDDINNENNLNASEQYRIKVISRGHSTPEMAGAFASQLNAQYLILNHFSSRYASLNHNAILQPDWNDQNIKAEVERIYQESTVSSQSLPPQLPNNVSKRDLLSKKEKELLQEVNEHGLTIDKQKIVNDWEVMEKIRNKAASTFQPRSLDHIILADDYLQVECNRQKVNSDTSSSVTTNSSIPVFRAWNHELI